MQLHILPQRQAQDGIKKAAGRERPATCTCPWQVIQFPKSPRFWQGLLLAFSTQPPTTRPFDEETAGAQKRFGYSSRLELPAVRREHSPRPLTRDAPPICPRTRTGGKLQTGPKLEGWYIQTRLAPYIGEWHLATFLILTATGKKKFVNPLLRTPHHLNCNQLQVPGWVEPPCSHLTGFQFLPALAPTRLMGRARDSLPAIPEPQPREQGNQPLKAHCLQRAARRLPLRPQMALFRNNQIRSPFYDNKILASGTMTPLRLSRLLFR